MGNSENENKKQTTRTKTRSETTEETDVLTAEEEKVVRARHGLSEGDDHELSFGLGASDEAKAQMARLESFLLEQFEAQEKPQKSYFGESGGGEDSEENATKQKIIDRLGGDND